MDEMEPGPVMVGRVSLLIVELGFLRDAVTDPRRVRTAYRWRPCILDSEMSSSASSDYTALSREA